MANTSKFSFFLKAEKFLSLFLMHEHVWSKKFFECLHWCRVDPSSQEISYIVFVVLLWSGCRKVQNCEMTLGERKESSNSSISWLCMGVFFSILMFYIYQKISYYINILTPIGSIRIVFRSTWEKVKWWCDVMMHE
jgi:hypothetical protein